MLFHRALNAYLATKLLLFVKQTQTKVKYSYTNVNR